MFIASYLNQIPGVDVPLADFLISAACEEHVLLVLIGMQLGGEVHLALAQRADDLPRLRVPQLDAGLVAAAAQELGAIVVEVHIPHTLSRKPA